MGNLTRKNWAIDQQILSDDLNDVGKFSSGVIGELLSRLFYTDEVIINGLDVLPDAPASLTVFLQIGNAIQGLTNIGKPIIVDSIISKTFDIGGAQDRIDILEIKFLELDGTSQTRNFITPATGVVYTAATNTTSKFYVDLQIKKGTEGSSPSAPTTDTGYMKLSEIYIAAGSSAISSGNIKDVDSSSTWTTEANKTTRKKSILAHILAATLDHPNASVTTAKIADASITYAKFVSGASEFASGTKLIFYQAAAPTGWTIVNIGATEAMLKVVASGGAGGGAVSGSWTITGIQNESSHTHTIGNHAHDIAITGAGNFGTADGGPTVAIFTSGGRIWGRPYGSSNSVAVLAPNTDTASGGGTTSVGSAHAHTFDGTWRPANLSVIVASKD